MRSTRVVGVGAVTMAGLAARYLVERGRSERSWPLLVESRLRDIGEVDEVSVLPLVERLTPDGSPLGGLRGEPGVSYLVRAGDTRLLFDTGLSGGRARSALVANAELLGLDLSALDAVVISHLHAQPADGGGRPLGSVRAVERIWRSPMMRSGLWPVDAPDSVGGTGATRRARRTTRSHPGQTISAAVPFPCATPQPGSPTPCERSQVNSSIPASAKHKHGPHPPHAQVILRRA
jgi:hypothetical protein